jgi:acetyl-CoA acetyltransferase/GAF domain-containing protein
MDIELEAARAAGGGDEAGGTEERAGAPAGPACAGDAAFAAATRVTLAAERAATLEDLLRVAAREAVALVGVPRCSVHLRDEKAGVFRGCIGHAGDRDIDAYVKRTLAGIPADGVTLELLRTKEPVIVTDARTDPRVIRSTVRFWRLRSMMAVPMLFGDEVIGIIHLDDPERRHAFSAEDARAAAMFARLAAVAVVHLRARLELEARAETAQRQVDALRRAAVIDEGLRSVVLAGGGVREIVGALARLLGKPCAVYNQHDVRLAAASPEGPGDGTLPRLLEPACLHTPEVRDALASGDADRPFVVGPLPSAGVLHRYVVAPVVVGGELLARLVVMEHQRRFSGGDMMAMRRAGMLLGLHLQAERRTIEADGDLAASLTADLLAGRADAAVLQRRADGIGLRLDTPRVVALVASRVRGTMPAGGVGRGAGRGRRGGAGARGPRDDGRGGRRAAPAADGLGDDGHVAEGAWHVLRRACARLDGAADVVGALSDVHAGCEGYAEAFVEAQQVLECIRRFAPGPGPDVFTAAELGAGRVFLAHSDRETVRRFAEATFGCLLGDATRADLLATLRSFFDNLASIRRCALRLGVHENTIRYRLARVEELTGLPVTHDPDAQLRARLSMLVLMLEGRLPAAVTATRTPGRRPARRRRRRSSARRRQPREAPWRWHKGAPAGRGAAGGGRRLANRHGRGLRRGSRDDALLPLRRLAADLAHRAVSAALADAGLDAAQVTAIFVGCAGAGSVPGGDALSVRLGLRRSGLLAGAGARVETVSASGARALHLAWRAVDVGLDDVVVCVGAERAPPDAPPDDGAAALLRRRSELARAYMTASGATVAHLARTAAKNRRHGARNPQATSREVQAGAILESDVVDWPLTRLMVAARGEGAAALVLTSEGIRRRIAGSRPRMRASVLAPDGGGAGEDRAALAARAYGMAGIGPDEVDCAELDDVTAAAELAAYEALGFVPVGHGPELIDTGSTALGGVLPVNTSGGMLSLGELDGASGVAQVCELARQLRGAAGGRQVPGARVGLAQIEGPAEDATRLVGVTVLTADGARGASRSPGPAQDAGTPAL